ncbi:MAG: glutamate-5-semialdehyde dehydrogenase [Alphaproteobacteria bacterium]
MAHQHIHEIMQSIGRKARLAQQELCVTDHAKRNLAIGKMAMAIRLQQDKIMQANQKDVDLGRAKGLAEAMVDRLTLDDTRFEQIVNGLRNIAELPDPVGRDLGQWTQPNGLQFQRVSVPLGVIGIIYESRPNVTADAAGLCVKSANASILRGGSEAFHTNLAIYDAIKEGLEQAGLTSDAVQFVHSTDRDAVGHMLSDMSEYIDILVPRGGKSLVARVQQEARVPVFAHLEGICHTWVDKSADFDKAMAVVFNAKMRRTGICGATETLLIDEAIAVSFLPRIARSLVEAGCSLRGCEKSQAIFPMTAATAEDWDTEYLAPILSIKIVEDASEAIAHIQKHSTGHTEAVITEDKDVVAGFFEQVDAAILMHNTSTQFADGGEFGFGAEIGIATGRIHARGPVGVEQLTSYKYLVRGDGQVRR